MLRIRLRRTGAKKQPRYRVVVADIRAPRDGAFVDSIGYYDPLTEPSTISINRESALDWISKGAQPSDTVYKLLRKAGIVEDAGPTYAAVPEGKKAAARAGRSQPKTDAAPKAEAAPAPKAEEPAAEPAAAAESADDDKTIVAAEEDGTSAGN